MVRGSVAPTRVSVFPVQPLSVCPSVPRARSLSPALSSSVSPSCPSERVFFAADAEYYGIAGSPLPCALLRRYFAIAVKYPSLILPTSFDHARVIEMIMAGTEGRTGKPMAHIFRFFLDCTCPRIQQSRLKALSLYIEFHELLKSCGCLYVRYVLLLKGR